MKPFTIDKLVAIHSLEVHDQSSSASADRSFGIDSPESLTIGNLSSGLIVLVTYCAKIAVFFATYPGQNWSRSGMALITASRIDGLDERIQKFCQAGQEYIVIGNK